MEKLRRLRTEKGLSQAKLAARAELDPSTVNQIERGAREASPATLRKLAEALDVSIVELLEDVSPKARGRSSPEPTLFDGAEGERRNEWREAYDRLGRTLLDQWERELPKELLYARQNPGAFSRWVDHIAATVNAYSAEVIRLGLPEDEPWPVLAIRIDENGFWTHGRSLWPLLREIRRVLPEIEPKADAEQFDALWAEMPKQEQT